MNSDFMKTRPIFPLLLSMSLPMVISMLVNSLYNIIDSFFVAKISEDAMTSLSLVFPVQNFISATAIGFGIGINAVIAIYLGAGRKEKADIAATQGLALSALHGIVLMIICKLIMPAFLSMFTSNKNVVDLGVQYCNIVFTFSPALMLAIAFEKIFQSVGRMKISMFSMLCGCIANIILDPLLIFGVGFFPEMGIKGAALATGIGQVLTLVIYIIAFLQHLILHCRHFSYPPSTAYLRHIHKAMCLFLEFTISSRHFFIYPQTVLFRVCDQLSVLTTEQARRSV